MRLQRVIVQLCILSMALFMLAACDSDDGGSSSSGFSISPSSLSIGMGAMSQLVAKDSGTNVSSSATWSSSNSNIVRVSDSAISTTSPRGTITAVHTGTATITADYNGQSASATITVTSATLDAIQVTPIYPALALAATPEIQFTATGIYSDGSKLDLSEYVTWSSDTPGTATISNTAGTGGLASTVAAGNATIQAVFESSSGSITGTTQLTLNAETINGLQVTQINPTVSVQDNSVLPFTATVLITDSSTALGTDGTTQDVTKWAIWSSGTPAVATVSNSSSTKGDTTALTAGSAGIDADYNGTTSTDIPALEVANSTLGTIQIFPVAPSIAVGVVFQLTAKGIYDTAAAEYTTQDLTKAAVWSSSDTTVATICNSYICKGNVSALAAGTTTITASMPSGTPVTITLTVNDPGITLSEIQVTPTNPSVYLLTNKQFTATGIYTDGTSYFHQDVTKKAIWSSSDESIAIASNATGSEGKIKNIAAGTATITATIGSVSSGSDLTVLASAMALTSIEISPKNPFIIEGMMQQFTATGEFTDGTTTVLGDITNDVLWYSAATPTAGIISNTLGSKGLVTTTETAGATTTTNITAAMGNLTSNISTLTDYDTVDIPDFPYISLEMAPENDSYTLPVGASLQLEAIGVFNNAGDYRKMDLTEQATWYSDDPSVVSVDNHNGTGGLLRGISAGTANITVYWTDIENVEWTATKAVTVDSSTLQSIQITPSNRSLDLGMTQQFEALGVYSDGSSYSLQALPPELVWLSADSTTSSTINAPIGNDGQHSGLATALTAGTSTITATLGSVSTTETLTTSNVTLQSITVSPTNQTIITGSKVQFKASGSYSDGVNRDITNLVQWDSGAAATTFVDNGPGMQGIVVTGGAETATITATLGAQSGSTTLDVISDNGANPTIELTPSTPVLGVGTTLQMSATVIFDDGTSSYSQDVTDLAYWSSNVTAEATVGNGKNSSGRIYGVSVGATADITASWTDGDDNVATLTILNIEVVDTAGMVIEIAPGQPSGPVGFTEQLTATALYADSNTQDISESVVWTSSDTSVVTVSNAEGSRGKITRISYGTADITARFGTTSATATVTAW